MDLRAALRNLLRVSDFFIIPVPHGESSTYLTVYKHQRFCIPRNAPVGVGISSITAPVPKSRCVVSTRCFRAEENLRKTGLSASLMFAFPSPEKWELTRLWLEL
ncbi:hypothetical protein QN277_009008 [Acacia crassicarpa]|uniref:Uncharacterized protein n=1 Tax=Acacia crassicarpa TaxID=499986 RepID=A0AAE1IS45_9FABA|nr:hypothetical protein QN277_009008 [Acacia crassicarpa]